MPLFPNEKAIALAVMGEKRAKDWPATARYLEDKHGLPRVDTLMGGRFWPAVVEFFREHHGLRSNIGPDEGRSNVSPSIRLGPFKPDGKENFDAAPGRGRRR
jgi:hypothetical protein